MLYFNYIIVLLFLFGLIQIYLAYSLISLTL
jgi:hypothetical protein